jgi:UDP-N-acetylmuramyl tripeptide synthase
MLLRIHGIDQDRIAGLSITRAVFTNLTQDHLDYHQDLEAYQQTKAQLFSLASVQFAILNRDDTHYADFLVVRLVNTARVMLSPAILSWSMPCDDTSNTAVLMPSFS